MTVIKRSALVSYTPQQMFDLVNDVEAYPQFLPGCSGAKILEHTAEEMCASLELKKGFVKHSFTTRNKLIKNERIEMSLVEGPFSHLQGCWIFEGLQGQGVTEDADQNIVRGTRISLQMTFGFSNKLVSKIFGPIFINLLDTLINSFNNRAKEIYGRNQDT